MSVAEGAAIPTAGITAWHAMFSSAELKTGETVLIHAGAGGVGTFAVQFAHAAGAHVIATASGDGLVLAHSLGADEVIDYKTQDFTAIAKNVDVVLDLVGGETQLLSFNVLKTDGRLVSTAMPRDESKAKEHNVSASIFYAKPFADRLHDLVNFISEKKLSYVCTEMAKPLDQMKIEGRSVAEVLPSFGRELVRTALSPRTLAVHRLLTTEGKRFPEIAQAMLASSYLKILDKLAAWIAAHQASSVSILSREIPARVMAEQFMSMTSSDVKLRAIVGLVRPPLSDAEIDDIVSNAVHTFLYGTAVRPASPRGRGKQGG